LIDLMCLVAVAEFKCVEMTVVKQNCMHEEVGNRKNWQNACCYHLVQNVSLANCYRDT